MNLTAARLGQALQRRSDPIESALATEEIAARICAIIDQDGPRSVAIYAGTYAYIGSAVTLPLIFGFAEALSSRRRVNESGRRQPEDLPATPDTTARPPDSLTE